MMKNQNINSSFILGACLFNWRNGDSYLELIYELEDKYFTYIPYISLIFSFHCETLNALSGSPIELLQKL